MSDQTLKAGDRVALVDEMSTLFDWPPGLVGVIVGEHSPLPRAVLVAFDTIPSVWMHYTSELRKVEQ